MNVFHAGRGFAGGVDHLVDDALDRPVAVEQQVLGGFRRGAFIAGRPP